MWHRKHSHKDAHTRTKITYTGELSSLADTNTFIKHLSWQLDSCSQRYEQINKEPESFQLSSDAYWHLQAAAVYCNQGDLLTRQFKLVMVAIVMLYTVHTADKNMVYSVIMFDFKSIWGNLIFSHFSVAGSSLHISSSCLAEHVDAIHVKLMSTLCHMLLLLIMFCLNVEMCYTAWVWSFRFPTAFSAVPASCVCV